MDLRQYCTTMRQVVLLFSNNPKAYYYPGEVIRGFCQINANQAHFNKIHLELEGFSSVGWSTKKIKITQDMKEETRCLYLERTILVDKSTLGPGIQCWPFSFRLPDEIPPSFEGMFGHIRYWLKAEIQAQHETIGKTVTSLFIKSNTNLNGDFFAAPVSGQIDENVKRMLITSGSIEIQMETDRSSYCENDFIVLNGYIHNKSNHSVRSRVYLVQEQIFRTATSQNIVQQLRYMTPIASAPIIQNSIAKGEQRLWQNVSVLLVAPSPTFRSQLIDVTHHLEIEVRSRFVKPVSIRLPILISTVPIFHRADQLLEALFSNLPYEDNNLSPSQRGSGSYSSVGHHENVAIVVEDDIQPPPPPDHFQSDGEGGDSFEDDDASPVDAAAHLPSPILEEEDSDHSEFGTQSPSPGPSPTAGVDSDAAMAIGSPETAGDEDDEAAPPLPPRGSHSSQGSNTGKTKL